MSKKSETTVLPQPPSAVACSDLLGDPLDPLFRAKPGSWTVVNFQNNGWLLRYENRLDQIVPNRVNDAALMLHCDVRLARRIAATLNNAAPIALLERLAAYFGDSAHPLAVELREYLKSPNDQAH